MPTINLVSVTGMLVELKKTFLQEVAEIPRLGFCRKYQHARNHRVKNSKSSEFYFEGLWRCTEEVRTT
jgi:hypothetical protein